VKVFVVKVGNCEELNDCERVLKNYFKKYNLDSFFLTDKIANCHPSWYKLKAFDYVNDDFVLCWDLDLLPKKNADSIVPFLDYNKINLAIDTAVILKNLSFLNGQKYFKYNCGLMGIPRSFKSFCDEVFEYSKNKILSLDFPNPSPTEQYIINQKLYETYFKDVHEIESKFNTLYYTCKENIKNLLDAYFIHYTAFNITPELRRAAIKKHVTNYFSHI